MINILIVRKHNQIGDMLCSLPLYASVKKKYPGSHITLVVSQTNYPVPFKEINPFVDEVIFYDKSSLLTILKFFIQLRKKKYFCGIVPSTIKLSATSHIINFLSGAVKRVGVNSIDGIKNPSAYLLNTKKDFWWEKNQTHQSERNLDIARLAGFNLPVEEKEIRFSFSPEVINAADDFIKQNFPEKKMIIGFHPGAGKETSRWHEDNFIQLITQLHKKYNNYILFTCGNLDKEVVNKIVNELSAKGIPSVVENLPLLTLAALLDKISLYVTNDTGTMHIAGKTRVNQISLFGPMHAYEWAPTGINKYYLKSETGEINKIKTEAVLALCNKIIGCIKMDLEKIRSYCLKKKGVTETLPFNEDTPVYKVMGKIFLLSNLTPPVSVNIKCDPELAVELRERYDAVTPGYHMNKIHWNTILLDGSVPDKFILEWIDLSYNLVASSLPKKDREILTHL